MRDFFDGDGYLYTLITIILLSLLVFIAYREGPAPVLEDTDKQTEVERGLDEIDREYREANAALDALSKELDRLEKEAGE